jgi:DNA-binding LacI/PurR family transcriptional regulator
MAEISRKPTLEDVARAAGVSRALVSIVMREAPGASEQTRARVLEIADDLGYRPDARARLLARATTRLLGIVYRVDALHHSDLLAPIYDAAETAGYELILSGRTRHHDERHAVNTLLGYRCDALLMLGTDMSEPELNRLSETLPVVLAGRRMSHPAPAIDSVRTDEVAGMRLAVNHLASLGHTEIVHVDGGPGTIQSDRRRGYRAAMAALGLRDRIRIATGDGLVEGGQAAAEAIFSTETHPTAVIAYNDETAFGVMRAVRRLGLAIPGDVSVVGYDGTRVAQLVPRPLTTIRQDAVAIGREAVRLAISRLEGEVASPTDEVLPPGFEAGETTGPVTAPTAGAA